MDGSPAPRCPTCPGWHPLLGPHLHVHVEPQKHFWARRGPRWSTWTPSSPPTHRPGRTGTRSSQVPQKLVLNWKRHHVVNIPCLSRSQHAVSHQPVPLRPPSPHPQPDEVVLHVAAASARGVLQPVAAAAPVPAAAPPPLLPDAASCQVTGAASPPPAAPASPLPPTVRLLSGADTQPQPLPLRGACRGGQTRPTCIPAGPDVTTISLGCTCLRRHASCCNT